MAVRERILKSAAAPASAGAGRVNPYDSSPQFVMTGEDALRINVVNRHVGVRVGITGRFIDPNDGAVKPFSDAMIPTADGLESTKIIFVGAAVFLHLVVRALDERIEPGETFARLEVVRGIGGAPNVLGVLLAGYIGSWGGMGWPGTPLQTPWEGRGFVHSEFDPFLVPGANPRIVMPDNCLWRILAIGGSLVTSAAGATRHAYLQLVQQGLVLWQAPSTLPQAPSTGFFHAWGAGYSGVADASNQTGLGAIPQDLFLENHGALAGEVRMSTVGLDPGDAWTNVSMLVEEWRNPVSTFS